MDRGTNTSPQGGYIKHLLGLVPAEEHDQSVENCLKSLEHIDQKLAGLPDGVRSHVKQGRVFLEMLKDYCNGTYTKVPWNTVVVASLTLLRSYGPGALISEALGALDEAALIVMAGRALHADINEYMEFKTLPQDKVWG